MPNPHPSRGALFGLLATCSALACGSGSTTPDNYYGAVFATDGTDVAFDSKFLGQTCGNSGALPCRDSFVKYACPTSTACYPAQQGYSGGNSVYFYNLVSMSATLSPLKACAAAPATCASGSMPNPLPVAAANPQLLGGGGAHADSFPHSCVPGAAYDPRTDAYSTAYQFPIFNALPLATTAFGAIVYPIVAVHGVTLSTNETCNDLKDARSIADASNAGGGTFGATRTEQPTSYQLWAPIDSTAIVAPIPGALNPNYAPLTAWYEGLQLQYLDGGPIPTTTVINPDNSTTTTLLAMDGVIVDPAGSSFSDVTDAKVILLPAAPGDDAYSPIVRLHDYHLQSGQSIGSVTGICQPSDPHPCPANTADYTKASASPFYVIFIASTPQQAQ